jgi:hypothetical protein
MHKYHSSGSLVSLFSTRPEKSPNVWVTNRLPGVMAIDTEGLANGVAMVVAISG